jgi:O-antigen/teichoic acid export membrane protein
MEGSGQISENSKRIAKNTLALYFRMFVLMLIGLFTARVVLNSLGVEDKGVYETVGGFVSMMAIITSSLSTAISRFLTVEIGRSNQENLRKVFSTAVAIMLLVALIVVLVAEPLGMWYIGSVMQLPDGRTGAALILFQFSLATFVINLVSVPFNAAIIAHERMSAFAVIGVVEGVLKLAVALLLLLTPFDKLITYGALMCCVALIARMMYAMYCRHFFEESRVRPSFDKTLFKAMSGFAGWNGLSYGVYLVNTQGVTLLVNYFFGVVFNTMRGIALNVETMVKQFITNVLTAMNPQITKSFAKGDYEYAFSLACKGSKYSVLIVFLLGVPFLFEAEILLRLWLGDIVPEGTALFTRLALAGLCLDLLMNPFSTIIQASGDIKRFYIVISSITFLIFPLTWVLFKAGAPAYSCYLVFIGVYLVGDVVKLGLSHRQVGFPLKMFASEVLLKVFPVAALTLAVTFPVWKLMDAGLWRLLAVLATGTGATLLGTYFFALTRGERNYVNSKLHIGNVKNQ